VRRDVGVVSVEPLFTPLRPVHRLLVTERMSRVAVAALLTFASLASEAAADEAAPAAGIDARAEGDAAAGRSYFAPTALTAPGGSGVLSIKAPLYPAISGTLAMGVTDRVEVSVGGGAFAEVFSEGADTKRAIMGGAKLQIVKGQRGAIALTASVHRRAGYHEFDPFGSGMDVPARISGEVGAVGTQCTDETCATIVSMHAHYMPDLSGGDTQRGWGGFSLVSGRGGSRFVLDASAFAESGDRGERGFLAYVGYRAARRGVAFDAGALVIAIDDEVMPWPTFGLSTRF
jgi:hypothetical protein